LQEIATSFAAIALHLFLDSRRVVLKNLPNWTVVFWKRRQFGCVAA